MLKRILIIGCLLSFGLAIAGCNTLNGAGKDLSAGGQAMSDLAS